MIYTVHIQPGGYTLFVDEQETVLEAAQRQGYAFPWSCQQAICGTCQGKILSGQVRYEVPLFAIDATAQQAGIALFCSAKPCSDLVIEIIGVEEPLEYPIREAICKVKKLQALNAQVWQITLEQPDRPINYRSGQYLELIPENFTARPYSITCAPNTQTIELQVRCLPENVYTSALLTQLKMQQYLKVAGPYGKLRYQRTPTYPIIFIAAGTGFAPYKALLEQLWQDPHHPPIYLYWGVRFKTDLYWHTQLLDSTATERHFTYYPVVTRPDANWQGATGLVYAEVLRHHPQLHFYHVYACGPPEMVLATRTALIQHGLSLNRFYSDWLDYLPPVL